jgi:hypothetical protein
VLLSLLLLGQLLLVAHRSQPRDDCVDVRDAVVVLGVNQRLIGGEGRVDGCDAIGILGPQDVASEGEFATGRAEGSHVPVQGHLSGISLFEAELGGGELLSSFGAFFRIEDFFHRVEGLGRSGLGGLFARRWRGLPARAQPRVASPPQPLRAFSATQPSSLHR